MIPRPLSRIRPVAATLLGGFALLAVVVSTAPAGLAALNDGVMELVISLRSPLATSLFSALSTMGNPPVLAVIVALTSAVLLVRGRVADGVFVVLSTATSAAFSELFKALVASPRPVVERLAYLPSSDSFPSGHTISFLVFVGAVALVAASATKSQGVRIAILAFAAVFSVAMGFARMYLGLHWLTDVAGSFLLGGALLATTADTWMRVKRASGEA